jgi:hypothetical protein
VRGIGILRTSPFGDSQKFGHKKGPGSFPLALRA